MRHAYGLATGALACLLLLAGCGSAGDIARETAGPTNDSLDAETVAAVRAAARPLSGAAADYDPLFELIGDARVVLLGEATHGTHEFYRERARITRRLVEEKGFTAVAIEGDWPDAYRVDRYVRGWSEEVGPAGALGAFERFPTWMWRNEDVVAFVEWLRAYNASRPATSRVGFYGLDLYSLAPSLDAVTTYLEQANPEAARRARRGFRCFDRFRDDPIGYGQAVEYGGARSCRDVVADQVRALERLRPEPDGSADADEAYFAALQNAYVVQRAEEYYRSMFLRGVSTWNLRDRHMMRTLEALTRHLGEGTAGAKVVVWAHNSHVGDARATHQGDGGELTLGQLARTHWGHNAVLVGFTTYTGTVTAASEWGGSPERKAVRPALPGSYEEIFHRTGLPRFLLPLRATRPGTPLRHARLERAIGVIYLPHTERVSHYFHARLPDQFDAVIHIDTTHALTPLAPQPGTSMGEYPLAPRG